MDLGATSEMMGMPVFVVTILALVEVGGVLLLVGGGFGKDWMTRTAGLGFAAVMLGAIFMVHLPNGWNSIGEMGMEFQFTLLMTSLYFLVVGNAEASQGA